MNTFASLSATDLGPVRPQRMNAVIRAEFRKMTTTRSGPAVLLTAVGITVIALVWTLFQGDSVTVSWREYAQVMPVAGLVLAVIGLLAMTSEWTQRTALTTFTLSPRRGRVLGAKFLAALTLSMIGLVVMVGLILGAAFLGGALTGQEVSFDGFGGDFRGLVILTVLQVTMAAGFGALAAQTAVAVAAYFAAPTFVSIIGFQLLHDNARWLDVFAAYDRLSSPDPWADGVQTLTSIAFWVVLPAAVGVWRSLTREVK